MFKVNNKDTRTMAVVDVLLNQLYDKNFAVKAAATDKRYFARSNFFGCVVHKKNFGLIGQVVFK